jgi:VWFA-related protein
MKNITECGGTQKTRFSPKGNVKVRYLELLVAVVLLLPAARVSAQQGVRVAQPNAARFPEVTLFAYPTDERGIVPGGLGTGAFQVIENGSPARILKVEGEGGSIDVCLALDRSPSMLNENKLEYARAAAHEFVNQLRPQDRAALITFADGNTLDQALTSDRVALHAAVDRAQASGDRTTFYDAVYWSITQVAVQGQGSSSVVGSGPARPDARRVVLALTDGMDLGSRILPKELLDLARQNGVSLCMVSLGRDAATLQMLHLARETGGIHLLAPRPQELQQMYASLARQLRSEYRVTFRSPKPETDSTRRNVKVELPGMHVSADTWYQAPGTGSLVAGVPPVDPGGAPVTGATTGKGLPPLLLLGGLLMAVGLTGAGVALFIWVNNRQQRLPVTDSNPRLDLLPLWVREGSTRIGRGPECELVLDSREVSRVHARIEAWDGIFRILDEGSSNGTYVNGRRVRRKELRVGDIVRFGDREFRFAGEMRA